MRNVDTPMPGRLTSLQATELFKLRREAPAQWTAAALANRYNVDEAAVGRVLRYSVLPAITNDENGSLGWWQVCSFS